MNQAKQFPVTVCDDILFLTSSLSPDALRSFSATNHIDNDSAKTEEIIRVFIKSLAGDIISLDCSPDDSLLHLKRQITAAAATQLGLDWPVFMQKLLPLSNVGSVEIGGGDRDDRKQDDTIGSSLSQADADKHSLQNLHIGDGDVLALLIEDQVLDHFEFFVICSDYTLFLFCPISIGRLTNALR
jgi:hypothetical protein